MVSVQDAVEVVLGTSPCRVHLAPLVREPWDTFAVAVQLDDGDRWMPCSPASGLVRGAGVRSGASMDTLDDARDMASVAGSYQCRECGAEIEAVLAEGRVGSQDHSPFQWLGGGTWTLVPSCPLCAGALQACGPIRDLRVLPSSASDDVYAHVDFVDVT